MQLERHTMVSPSMSRNIRLTTNICSSTIMNGTVKSERGLSSLLAFVGERKMRNTPDSLLVDFDAVSEEL